jgi:hypothetical protein
MKPEYIETHLAKHEYVKEPQPTENFKRLASAVF